MQQRQYTKAEQDAMKLDGAGHDECLERLGVMVESASGQRDARMHCIGAAAWPQTSVSRSPRSAMRSLRP